MLFRSPASPPDSSLPQHEHSCPPAAYSGLPSSARPFHHSTHLPRARPVPPPHTGLAPTFPGPTPTLPSLTPIQPGYRSSLPAGKCVWSVCVWCGSMYVCGVGLCMCVCIVRFNLSLTLKVRCRREITVIAEPSNNTPPQHSNSHLEGKHHHGNPLPGVQTAGLQLVNLSSSSPLTSRPLN